MNAAAMHERVRGCVCKVGYATIDIARKQAALVNATPNGKRKIDNGIHPAHAYHCRFCDLYHVGH
jgi:hypothetical protein